jgi:hypothetical protein
MMYFVIIKLFLVLKGFVYCFSLLAFFVFEMNYKEVKKNMFFVVEMVRLPI